MSWPCWDNPCARPVSHCIPCSPSFGTAAGATVKVCFTNVPGPVGTAAARVILPETADGCSPKVTDGQLLKHELKQIQHKLFMLRAAHVNAALFALRAASTRRCVCALAPGAVHAPVFPPRLSPRSCPRLLCGRLSTGSERIGFIGLGNMGAAMATNILKAHGSAIVYDVCANVCVRARAASLGAREATRHPWARVKRRRNGAPVART